MAQFAETGGMTPASSLDEVGALRRVVLKHAREAFVSERQIDREWQPLNFSSRPDFDAALREYDAFADVVAQSGADIVWLPADSTVGIDSIYVRDATAIVPTGLVACAMGKAGRRAEPEAQRAALTAAGEPFAGAVTAPASLEGGDIVWFDARTVAVGRGYRTNEQGIAQLGRMAGGDVVVRRVELPHWRGPSDVFHLMSMISPVDRDLAVVYARLLPVPFLEWLIELGIRLVEVPDEEFESMGANVLALAPRRCLMLDGNPTTRRRLEKAGADVRTYVGREISLKGGGGPTCLTRPLHRAG